MKPERRRIVEKNGELRTKLGMQHVKLFSWQYIKDFFISTMHLSWTTLYVTFSGLYFGSWFGFAVVWWIVFWFHGDFDGSKTNETCAKSIYGFTSCFLFSGIHIIRSLPRLKIYNPVVYGVTINYCYFFS